MVFIFFLVYVAIKQPLTREYLKVVCITASNTWGLLLLTVLLGYGLVEIPKSVYDASKQTRKLNYLYFKVAKLSAEKCEAEEKLDDALEQIQHTYEAVLSNHRHLRFYMEIILEKCPEEWTNKLISRYANLEDAVVGTTGRSVTMTKMEFGTYHKQSMRLVAPLLFRLKMV